MAKAYSGRSSRGGARNGRTYSSTGSSPRRSSGVSPARLSQKSGSSNAFGGYTKVKHANGTFSMRRTAK